MTNDRFADLQPAWSPDGKVLAFVTDRSEETDLRSLTFSPMGIGLLDTATGEISRVLRPFPSSKHVNPQFKPGGGGLYFVSDWTGISDVYLYDFEEEQIHRVTCSTTGVTGISGLSPALSVAGGSGDLMFSVFEGGNYEIHLLAASDVVARPVWPGDPEIAAPLPPHPPQHEDKVSAYLADAATGLPEEDGFQTKDYSASLGLDYLGQIGVGFAVDRFGASLGGGVTALFSDMLGNHTLGVGLQLNGGLRDVGAGIFYQNLKGRVGWTLGASHTTYRTFATRVRPTSVVVDGTEVEGRVIEQELQRVFVERALARVEYPLSRTKRLEVGAGFSYYSYDLDVESFLTAGGQVLEAREVGRASPSSFGLGEASLALVGDNSFFGFTSPIKGTRYRFEVNPVFGSLRYQTILLDYRRYMFSNPVTFAFRALHLGRYGADAESGRLASLFLGYPTLVRGYDINSINVGECGDGEDCPVFDRLLGSRLGVTRLELRLQLLGTQELGLIPAPLLPTELTAFVDAGVAWSSDDTPALAWEADSRRRVPVFSAGVSARVAVLGALPLEAYLAHPFQRPSKDLVFGIHIAPGW
jgi:hypothetical protein